MFRVWGYSDDSPVRERVLAVFPELPTAIRYAEVSGMATQIVDENDVVHWTRYTEEDDS